MESAESLELTEEITQALSPERKSIQTSGKTYYGSGHIADLADMVEDIEEKRAPEVSLIEAANSAELVMAFYKSARTGQREPVIHYN